MPSFVPQSPEIETSFGSLSIRQDLDNHSVTIGLKDFLTWDVDTEQVLISKTIIHFIQPDGELVGLKVFSHHMMRMNFRGKYEPATTTPTPGIEYPDPA